MQDLYLCHQLGRNSPGPVEHKQDVCSEPQFPSLLREVPEGQNLGTHSALGSIH